MKKLGPITLPVPPSPIMVMKEEDIIDILLDLKLSQMADGLKVMTQDFHPKVLVFVNRNIGVFGVVMYIPPACWRDSDVQRFTMVIGQTLPVLIDYFYTLTQSKDKAEGSIAFQMLTFLEKLARENPNIPLTITAGQNPDLYV